jgi:predicted ester cyclase
MARELETEDMKVAERRFMEEVWNEGDYEVFEELVHDDYVGHWFSIDDEDTDYAGLKEFIQESRNGFSDFAMHEEFMFAEGDMIAVGATATGTHDGEFFDIPATNKDPGPTPVIMVHRFDDGQIIEGWATWDALGMMQNLGLVPQEFHLTDFLETGVNMARQGLVRRTAGDDD